MTYYDSISSGYNELHKEEQLRKLEIIKKNLDIHKKDKLLDVGCGTGFSLDYFDCNCRGIEPSKKLAKNNKKINIGKAENLPFKDNSFNIVISITAIHNFDDVEKGLREIKRVGRDKFAFSVLKKAKNFTEIKKLIKRLFHIEKEIEEEKDIIFIGKII